MFHQLDGLIFQNTVLKGNLENLQEMFFFCAQQVQSPAKCPSEAMKEEEAEAAAAAAAAPAAWGGMQTHLAGKGASLWQTRDLQAE